MKSQGPIKSTFKDTVCPIPTPGGNQGASFGTAVPDGDKPTGSELKEVQFDGIKGGDSGAKDFMKVPGSSKG